MYTVRAFGRMIDSIARIEGYDAAIRAAVTPGAVVVDIGAGTGVWSLLACKYGASKVYAIEPDNAIMIGREAARENGMADRIEFIQDLSTRISLAERADVVVSDLRSVFPLFGENIPSIIDARERLLKPGGALIPVRDTLWATIVSCPRRYAQIADPWTDERLGVDLKSGLRAATNIWERVSGQTSTPLSQNKCWASLDYKTIGSPNVAGECEFGIEQPGIGHGFEAWFDAELGAGIEFSNSPTQKDSLYGRGYFSWPEAVDLVAGDVVSLRIRADLLGADYVWTWDTIIRAAGTRIERKHFRQSTLYAEPLAPAAIAKRAATHAPTLDSDGQIDLFILNHVDGIRSLQDIAELVVVTHPGRFETPAAVLTRVANVTEKYG